MQYVMIVILIIVAKLAYDIYNQNHKNGTKSTNTKSQKKTRSRKGEVIDLSNHWINMEDLPYVKKDCLLFGPERELFETCSQILKDTSYIAFPKVSLDEILTVAAQAPNRNEYFNRLRNRTINILICQRDGFRPILLIVAEGALESKNKQQIIEDRFIRKVADAAGIRFLHINLNELPNHDQLAQQLRNNILEQQ